MKKIKGKQIESVTAGQVTMPDRLVITKSVGEITVPTGGTYEIQMDKDGRTKTAWELFQEIFSKDNQPEITQPTLTIVNQTANNSVEIGTKVTPKFKITANTGSYTYGRYPQGQTDTGVAFNNCQASVQSGAYTESKENADTSGNTIEFTEITPTANVVARVSANNTAGEFARTQLGNNSNTRIEAGTINARNVTLVNVYRNYFYGVTDKSTDDLKTSIRTLGTKSNKAAVNNDTVTVSITDTTKKLIFIAIPVEAATKGIDVLKVSGSDKTPMTLSFVNSTHQPIVISVKGNNDYQAVDYNLFYAQFDEVYAGDKFQFTLTTAAN